MQAWSYAGIEKAAEGWPGLVASGRWVHVLVKGADDYGMVERLRRGHVVNTTCAMVATSV
jgi:hypothetical protein